MADAASMDTNAAVQKVEEAGKQGKLIPQAVENVKQWLTETRYGDYADQVKQHIAEEKWKQLDDVFWTVIPFGTGGRRGFMYPIGCNAINDRTIGESAQGLAEYVREALGSGAKLSCALAYDTRHRSRHFAELCAEIMVANGFQVFFLDGYRSTPALSYTIRLKGCSCGIMVTASHNPPSDNAVKAYWSTGGQLLPPHDQGVIDRVMQVQDIRRVPFAEALQAGQVVYCQAEVDASFAAQHKGQSFSGPRNLKILYSPLHGVGSSAVLPALKVAGFEDVEVFGPHAEPNADFPNVPGHVSNPENPAVFDSMMVHAQTSGAEVILATDPDADRVGCAAPLSFKPHSPWTTFTGNQIGALLADFVLNSRKRSSGLTNQHYVVKTLVTTELIRRIADVYGVKTFGDLQVGFKWIGGVMDEQGPEKFVFGCEESHGYLVGSYARDKDGAVAAMLLAELAAQLKAEGKTLAEQLDALFWQHGYHWEKTSSVTMPGSEGMARMVALMSRVRTAPPTTLAGMKVWRVRDYKNLVQFAPGETPMPFDGPPGDMVMLDLSTPDAPEGNYVAVRPSGTEPKVKFYIFTYEPAELLANLDDTRSQLTARVKQLQQELSDYALQE